MSVHLVVCPESINQENVAITSSGIAEDALEPSGVAEDPELNHTKPTYSNTSDVESSNEKRKAIKEERSANASSLENACTEQNNTCTEGSECVQQPEGYVCRGIVGLNAIWTK